MTIEPRRARPALRTSLAITWLTTLVLVPAYAAPAYQLSTISSTLGAPVMNATGTLAGISQDHLAIFQDGITTLVDQPANTNFSWATAINDQGLVLGGAARNTLVGGSVEQAGHMVTDKQQQFLYQNGKLTNLQQIIGLPFVSQTPGPSALVTGLNNSGDLVGAISQTGSPSKAAFVYRNGQVQTIATPGNWTSASASAINNLGVVVGSYETAKPGTSEFESGIFVEDHGKLTDLGGPEGGMSRVRGFNDKGQILIENTSGNWIYENGQFTALNTPSQSPDTFFSAKGLGEDGVVIGLGASNTWSAVPILYAHGQRYDPNALIDAQSAAQHHITDLLSINSKGDILALDQAGQQVLLSPLSAVPETGALKLMASGLGLMALLRRARRIKAAEQ